MQLLWVGRIGKVIISANLLPAARLLFAKHVDFKVFNADKNPLGLAVARHILNQQQAMAKATPVAGTLKIRVYMSPPARAIYSRLAEGPC